MRKHVVNLFLGLTVSVSLTAQPTTPAQESYTFSLQQCVDFGLQHQTAYLNAKLDVIGAKGKVGEVTAIGLPQANISGQYLVNPQVQKQFVPGNAFSSQQLTDLFGYVSEIGSKTGNPPPASFYQTVDQTVPSSVGFGVMYTSQATLTINQLLFDGTFFVGLKAADALLDLSKKTVAISEVQIRENITKAYYLVVINKERKKIFDANIARLDSTLKTTIASRDAGFVEDLDVKRLQVTVNNLKIEKEKFSNIEKISLAALKFQMGFPMKNELNIDGQMSQIPMDINKIDNPSEFDYNARSEYVMLESRRNLLTYDIKQNEMGYLPRLSAFFNYGQNTGAYEIKDIFNRWRWKEYHNYGLALNIPVFDGFAKSYKIQQAKINLQKADNDITNIKNSIDFQRDQSYISLQNSIKTLESQKKNLELSEEVARVTRIKYLKGVGSNLEVITAESTLKESQINYYSSLYDAMIAKIDYDKANGNLK